MSGEINLDRMTLDEMWQLHEEITELLSKRLTAEKLQLENRLAQLRNEKESRDLPRRVEKAPKNARRKYPQVHPKYRNPSEPSETWSGRGKQPRWLTAAIDGGRVLEDFAIKSSQSADPAPLRGDAEPTGSTFSKRSI